MMLGRSSERYEAEEADEASEKEQLASVGPMRRVAALEYRELGASERTSPSGSSAGLLGASSTNKYNEKFQIFLKSPIINHKSPC